MDVTYYILRRYVVRKSEALMSYILITHRDDDKKGRGWLSSAHFNSSEVGVTGRLSILPTNR